MRNLCAYIEKIIAIGLIYNGLFRLCPFVLASSTGSSNPPFVPNTNTHPSDTFSESKIIESSNTTSSIGSILENTSTTVDKDDWKKDLPPSLQNRRTLYRFFLPRTTSRHLQKQHLNPADGTFSEDYGCEVLLLGTSHISSSSCDDVKHLMNFARPGKFQYISFFYLELKCYIYRLKQNIFIADCLFLEICPQRVPILEKPIMKSSPEPIVNQPYDDTSSTKKKHWYQLWKKSSSSKTPKPPSLMEQIQTIQSQSPDMSATSALSTVLLSQIQDDYATKLNITVGAEFREAVQMAIQQNNPGRDPSESICRVILGDRPVKLTLLRTWESLNIWFKFKLVLGLLWSCLPFNQPSDEELKEWMDSILSDGGDDILSKSMKDLAKQFPSIERVIIHERDRYMYAKLNQIARMGAKRIVAVVGAGHCKGICSLVKFQLDGIEKIYFQDNFEDVLKDVIETKRYKVNQNDDDPGEIQELLTDVIELNIQQPVNLPYPYADHLPTDFVDISRK